MTYKGQNYKGTDAGSSNHYTGPGSSYKQNKAVGVGQDTPAAERKEKAAEKLEGRAIGQLQKAQKMETGAGGMGRASKTPVAKGGKTDSEKFAKKKVGAGAGIGIPPGIMGAGSPPPALGGVGPPMGGMSGPPPLMPRPMPMPGGAIAPAGRRPGKLARKTPTMFRRGR